MSSKPHDKRNPNEKAMTDHRAEVLRIVARVARETDTPSVGSYPGLTAFAVTCEREAAKLDSPATADREQSGKAQFIAGFRHAVELLGKEGDYRCVDWSAPYQYLGEKLERITESPQGGGAGDDSEAFKRGADALSVATTIAGVSGRPSDEEALASTQAAPEVAPGSSPVSHAAAPKDDKVVEPFDRFLATKLKEMPDYRPYCMRCPGLKRMGRVEYGYWRCDCGAEQDSRNGLKMIETEAASWVEAGAMLPCPFCGGSCWVPHEESGHHVECHVCMSRNASHETAEAAIAAWNHRPSPQEASQTQGEVEALIAEWRSLSPVLSAENQVRKREVGDKLADALVRTALSSPRDKKTEGGE